MRVNVGLLCKTERSRKETQGRIWVVPRVPGSFEDVVGVVLTWRALCQPTWKTKTEDFAVEEADGEEKGATETGLQG